MAPIPTSRPSQPESRMYSRAHPASPEDDVVISGMGGKFPRSNNVQIFKDNLYNKVSVLKVYKVSFCPTSMYVSFF